LCTTLKNIFHSESFINRHKTAPHHFTRFRLLPFPSLILFMINLLKCSIQTELDSFFQILHHTDAPIRILTKAAFTKARAKFRYQAFVELNQHLIQYFESHFPLRTWHGLRLLAIDGTTLTLPKNDDTHEHFDDLPTISHHKLPMARASQLYDLLNRITLHASLDAYRVDERDLALSHGPYLRENDLLLLDRGYPAFWLFAWILSESAHFCARVSLESWRVVREFHQSDRRVHL